MPKATVLDIRKNGGVSYTVEFQYSDGGASANYFFNTASNASNDSDSIEMYIRGEVRDLCNNNLSPSTVMTVADVIIFQPKVLVARMDFAPGAHQSNAATNAPTNLNPLTQLLGALTTQVNDTNAKQNDIATKLNAVIAILIANGLMNP